MGNMGNWLIRIVLGLWSYPDTQCGFKMLSGKAAQEVASRMVVDRFGFDFELIVLAKKLGFKIKGKLVEVPTIRTDIETQEDLAEEVANIYGYNNILSKAPRIAMLPAKIETDSIVKDKVRDLLTGFGCDEVYNYSFVSKIALRLQGELSGGEQ